MMMEPVDAQAQPADASAKTTSSRPPSTRASKAPEVEPFGLQDIETQATKMAAQNNQELPTEEPAGTKHFGVDDVLSGQASPGSWPQGKRLRETVALAHGGNDGKDDDDENASSVSSSSSVVSEGDASDAVGREISIFGTNAKLRSHSSSVSAYGDLVHDVGTVIEDAAFNLRKIQSTMSITSDRVRGMSFQEKNETDSAAVDGSVAASPALASKTPEATRKRNRKSVLGLLLVDEHFDSDVASHLTPEERVEPEGRAELAPLNELRREVQELRDKYTQESQDGVHVSQAVFAEQFKDEDPVLVAQIWNRWAVPVGPEQVMMITIDDLCHSLQVQIGDPDSASRLDFLCRLLDSDEDGHISRAEFIDFLVNSNSNQGVDIDVSHFKAAVDSIFDYMHTEDEDAGDAQTGDDPDDLTYAQIRIVMQSMGLHHLFGPDRDEEQSGRPSAALSISSVRSSDGTAQVLMSSRSEGKKRGQSGLPFEIGSEVDDDDDDANDAGGDKGRVGRKCCCCHCRCLDACSGRSLIQNAPRMFWLGFFFIGLIGHMVFKFLRYCGPYAWGGDDCPTDLMGYGVCFARSGSQGTMWCVMALLWPVCRGFLTRLRSNAFCCCCCCRNNDKSETGCVARIIPFDDRLLFHKVAAWSLIFCTVVHVIAHLYNYSLYHVASDEAWNKSCLVKSGLGPQPEYWEVALLTLPGTTGHLMLLILLISIPLALPRCRRTCFNTFWFSHQLLLVFIGLFIAHGTAEWLEWSVTWIYVGPPLAIYLYERALRCLHPQRHVKLQDAQLLKGDVVVLVMDKPRFMRDFKAGMYVNLLIPALSKYEWHPFTVSSAPSDPKLTLHIRAAGDWTRALCRLISECEQHAQQKLEDDLERGGSRGRGRSLVRRPSFYNNPMQNSALAMSLHHAGSKPHMDTLAAGAHWDQDEQDGRTKKRRGTQSSTQSSWKEKEAEAAIASFLPRVQIEGPFGAPTEAYREFKAILLIGAGIGVTPFLSVIREICNLWASHRVPPAIAAHIRKAQTALQRVAAAGAEVAGEKRAAEAQGDAIREALDAARIELEQGLKASLVTLYPKEFCVKKIYFHWLTRGQASLQWFAQEISALAHLDPESRIEMHMHLTSTKVASAWSRKLLRLAQVAARTVGGVDAISGIKGQKTNTHFGRPNWDHVFKPISKAYRGRKVGVFFCGPDKLREVLAEKCREWSHGKHKTRFIMHSEKF